MIILLSSLLLIFAIATAIVTLVLVVEVAGAAFLPIRTSIHPAHAAVRRPVVILVPAHNESAGIGPTLNDIVAQMQGNDRLLVVADNCTDDTAEIASAAGTDVVIRHDREKIGKGYALDFGLRYLGETHSEVIIVIDADCRLEAGTIDQLARNCTLRNRPVQALYAMSAPEGSAVSYRVAEFAWRVKNSLRPRGLASLGLPCQLMGTGMAFPRDVLRLANLATGHLAEDLHLGLALASMRHAPFFCPTAVVRSEFPTSAEGAATQRQRWEQGHLHVLLTEAVPHIWTAIRTGNWRLLALSLDAAVPPITLLGWLIAGLLLASCLIGVLGGQSGPLLVSAAAMVLFVGVLALAWARCGRDLLPARTLISIGPYVAGKFGIYMRMLSSKGTPKWVRTERNKPNLK
jgi:cellulose synthase/poly-beta-1,6-N-acetylglucosamine synthase-like glycosyltransferase